VANPYAWLTKSGKKKRLNCGILLLPLSLDGTLQWLKQRHHHRKQLVAALTVIAGTRFLALVFVMSAIVFKLKL